MKDEADKNENNGKIPSEESFKKTAEFGIFALLLGPGKHQQILESFVKLPANLD